MLIDWFTVGAQIINFLILLALLKIFLFDRITRAMDEREEKINSRFEEADRKKQEVRQEAQSLEKQKRELDENREQLIAEAEADAESRRKEWVDQARREVEQLRGRWKDALAEQQASFGRDLRRLTAEQVYAVSRRVLKDLADEAVEERIVEAFIRRAMQMDRAEKNKFSRSLDTENSSATVRSAFDISTKMRQKITRALHQEISEALEIDYQTEPDMLAGIELKAAGKKIGWSVDEYLRTLEETVLEAIQEQARKDTGRSQEQTQPNNEQKDSGENDGKSG
ncbi:MAG: F0F1 ATP synthase subunit delta [Desulfobacterales bacterium]|jgi:F-type H+-transporting ATPase subunit b